MCGIIGFTGRTEASPILLEGLRRLEYRGYDSAGMVTGTGNTLHLRKKAGRIAELTKAVHADPAPGHFGISHTRWATHGGATDRNAHPHIDATGTIAVVHNGVIENYMSLKHKLQADGIEFRSDTDTEVLAHLISRYYQGDLMQAVRFALDFVKGTYGIAVMAQNEPGVIVGARLGSPLVIGIGPNGHYLASDANAFAGYADKVVYLNDRQICQLDQESWVIRNQDLDTVDAPIQDIKHFLGEGDAEIGDYPHFMLKEIYEQPETIANAMRGRLDESNWTAHFGGLNLTAKQLRSIDRVVMTACGTSYHSCLVGEYLFEELARIPVEVEYASELRYRNPPMDRSTFTLAVTQSGESADTLAAMRESKRMGHPTLAICNVVGSTIAREADGGVYLHAGPEIGVASTKAFTTQLAGLYLLTLALAQVRGRLSDAQEAEELKALRHLPVALQSVLALEPQIIAWSEDFARKENALFLGRGLHYPIAMEGALKLKEISYIHAEAYPAGELKHGPLALVTDQMPVVTVAPNDALLEKLKSNLQEVRARGGQLYVFADGDTRIESEPGVHVIRMPEHYGALSPILHVVPLQLLAYHTACARGTDVDKPRNLAKSVTVE